MIYLCSYLTEKDLAYLYYQPISASQIIVSIPLLVNFIVLNNKQISYFFSIHYM